MLGGHFAFLSRGSTTQLTIATLAQSGALLDLLFMHFICWRATTNWVDLYQWFFSLRFYIVIDRSCWTFFQAAGHLQTLWLCFSFNCVFVLGFVILFCALRFFLSFVRSFFFACFSSFFFFSFVLLFPLLCCFLPIGHRTIILAKVAGFGWLFDLYCYQSFNINCKYFGKHSL